MHHRLQVGVPPTNHIQLQPHHRKAMSILLNLFLNILGFSVILAWLTLIAGAVILVIHIAVYLLREFFFPPKDNERTHE